jgi:hypothetical protein
MNGSIQSDIRFLQTQGCEIRPGDIQDGRQISKI